MGERLDHLPGAEIPKSAGPFVHFGLVQQLIIRRHNMATESGQSSGENADPLLAIDVPDLGGVGCRVHAEGPGIVARGGYVRQVGQHTTRLAQEFALFENTP
jgi:hypothetical protein